jgi:hypothetical protein
VSWPTPTRADHQRFCETEGWKPVRNARGGTGTHHVTFELELPDGRILRTRISHPPDRTDYGARLWSHILRDQLCVDEAAFWACLRDGVVPNRGFPPPPVQESTPTQVIYLLLNEVGLPEQQVGAMSKQEAIDRLNQYWTTGR